MLFPVAFSMSVVSRTCSCRWPALAAVLVFGAVCSIALTDGMAEGKRNTRLRGSAGEVRALLHRPATASNALEPWGLISHRRDRVYIPARRAHYGCSPPKSRTQHNPDLLRSSGFRSPFRRIGPSDTTHCRGSYPSTRGHSEWGCCRPTQRCDPLRAFHPLRTRACPAAAQCSGPLPWIFLSPPLSLIPAVVNRLALTLCPLVL